MSKTHSSEKEGPGDADAPMSEGKWNLNKIGWPLYFYSFKDDEKPELYTL